MATKKKSKAKPKAAKKKKAKKFMPKPKKAYRVIAPVAAQKKTTAQPTAAALRARAWRLAHKQKTAWNVAAKTPVKGVTLTAEGAATVTRPAPPPLRTQIVHAWIDPGVAPNSTIIFGLGADNNVYHWDVYHGAWWPNWESEAGRKAIDKTLLDKALGQMDKTRVLPQESQSAFEAEERAKEAAAALTPEADKGSFKLHDELKAPRQEVVTVVA